MIKALKIAGVLIAAIWMAWATKTLLDIRAISLEVCDIATGEHTDYRGKMPWPVQCPNYSLHELRWRGGVRAPLQP